MDFPLRGFLFLFMEFTSWSKTHIQRNSQSDFTVSNVDDMYVMYPCECSYHCGPLFTSL